MAVVTKTGYNQSTKHHDLCMILLMPHLVDMQRNYIMSQKSLVFILLLGTIFRHFFILQNTPDEFHICKFAAIFVQVYQSTLFHILYIAGIDAPVSTWIFLIESPVFNLQYLLGYADLDMVRRYRATLGMENALRAQETVSPADHLLSG